LLQENSETLVAAMDRDFGYRSAKQASFAEIITSLRTIRSARRSLARWMRSERRQPGFPFGLIGARARIDYQPLGVVGIISPWNFPVNLTVGPLTAALAAGNRVLVKPSEHTPATASLLEELVPAYFAATELAVVNGDAETGHQFASLPLDHLVFTGSGAVAPHILAAAAPNLTPVTLELGGKSPVIIGRDADLRRAARSLIFGKVFNAGQVCLAPDTVYVPEHLFASLLEALREAAAESFGPQDSATDYVSIINARHAGRIDGYVHDAKSHGVETVELGPQCDDKEPNLRPVTLLLNPPPGCAVSQEEIFGPLLVLRSYEQLDDVLAALRFGPTPLALYYFGRERREREAVLAGTRSGGVTVNDVIMHYTVDDLPFGGVGASGMGAYHGVHGFRRLSHARAIYRQSPLDVSHLIRPPYGRGFAAVSAWLARFG
jgi:coniferyl-aldehyde dehydrogenase